jgi:hypothetical protein
MPQSATAAVTFPTIGPLPLDVDFFGGRLTRDGGLPWLAEADAALGLTSSLAAVIPDWRTRRGRHDLPTLLAQRIYQIACGYEDQDDADTLRRDPLLKQVCGRVPITGPDLASQPTFSRLENAIGPRTCYRLAQALGDVYLRERERDGVPTHVVLDLDGTDDPTHGAQEGSAYHGYYRQHMYHPLLVHDGTTGQLITAVLRPGTVHASHGVVAILTRIVTAIRPFAGTRRNMGTSTGSTASSRRAGTPSNAQSSSQPLSPNLPDVGPLLTTTDRPSASTPVTTRRRVMGSLLS